MYPQPPPRLAPVELAADLLHLEIQTGHGPSLGRAVDLWLAAVLTDSSGAYPPGVTEADLPGNERDVEPHCDCCEEVPGEPCSGPGCNIVGCRGCMPSGRCPACEADREDSGSEDAWSGGFAENH